MTDKLLTALESADMLLIDGLHAFDFSLEGQLLIECQDGRERKRWTFSLAQVDAAAFDPSLESWVLNDDSGEHRLVCMSAFTGNNNDEDEADDDA